MERPPSAPRAVRISPPTRADTDDLTALISECAAFHGHAPGAFDHAAAERDLFGPQALLRARLAWPPGDPRPIGVALWCDGYESAYAARGGYLCDLFVKADFRGLGAGRALLAAAARAVRDEGGVYLWWSVQPWNDGAKAFYASLGADADAIAAHALTHAAFDRLADEGED